MTFAIIVALMVVSGAGMVRLMWLMDGKPPLERPRWLRRRES